MDVGQRACTGRTSDVRCGRVTRRDLEPQQVVGLARHTTAARRTARPHPLVALQRQVGNSAVARMRLRRGASVVSRALIAAGADRDFDRFRALVEPAIGLVLARDRVTNRVTAVGTRRDPATSPALVGILTRVMDDPAQNAEVNFGTHQAGVAVGAFPQPPDLTGSRVQRIDLDDVEAIEAGAPGNGIAKFAHEIFENYTAHASVPTAGVSLFGPAHQQGVAAESAVAQDVVGPGTRIAERDAPGATAAAVERVQDFDTYYLVFTVTRHGAADFQITDARRAGRIVVNTYTVDGFATGSDAVPAAGAANIAAAAADLTAHPTATCHIEGFTDNVGPAAANGPLSERRARQARDAIRATGLAVGPGSFALFGRGATAFVAGNGTEAGRTRNRRVVITVREPAAPGIP
jgi:outer membrane protein OmpA-like peptidoglycan-associated protein